MRRRNIYPRLNSLPYSQTSNGSNIPLLACDMVLSPATAYIFTVHLDASVIPPNPSIQISTNQQGVKQLGTGVCDRVGDQMLEIPFMTDETGNCCIKLRSIAVKDAGITYHDACLETAADHALVSGGGLPGFFTASTAPY